MMQVRRLCLMMFVFPVLLTLSAWAQTPDPGAACSTRLAEADFQFDRKAGIYTADLSGIPPGATIFRAELTLAGRGKYQKPSTKPTMVYEFGKPDVTFPFVEPAFSSLDALDATRAAHKEGRALKIKAEVTLQGITALELSYVGCKSTADLPLVTNVRVIHRDGQSLITFSELKLEVFPEFKTGGDVAAFRKQFLEKHKGIQFHIWRSTEAITPATIHKARLVNRVGFFTAWNATYHQDNTGKKEPLRYRVVNGGEPVPWGTGIYAHNPKASGKAWYAVTVAVDGREDLAALSSENTCGPVDEVVGQGVPVLQWVERKPSGQSWSYRHGPLTRLIYTRWEAWPHSSTPSKPIDYLVALGDTPLPDKLPRDWAHQAWRVEPAPVGLHLHCWGGSLNGGYGWWYNAHKGAVLIASNQIPYDWWTGYHAANGTCQTFGDGHVHPFTMNRHFGFLDWAATQWKDAPESVRKDWRPLDLARVFTAGSSMGGAGAPMYALRHGDRIAACMSWVGVHMPGLSPTFKSSYEGSYGTEDAANTMPDGKTKVWDYFNDVWWMRNHIEKDTGLIIASNGKNDGAIGWKQAYMFARALQETRRPHVYNWALGGHGTRALFGSSIPFDVRTDCSLPAFSNCTLDGDIGTGSLKSKKEIAAEKEQQEREVKAGTRKKVKGEHSGFVGGNWSGKKPSSRR